MAWDSLTLREFAGGLDLVSSLSEIPEGFTPNAKNFRIAEYGGIEKVKGYSAFATVPASSHDMGLYAQADGDPKRLVCAVATGVYAVDASGNATQILSTWTAAADTTFALHEDRLYALDAANDIAVWTGTGSMTKYAPGVALGPPHGTILGIWQNRMWVATDNLTIRWSEPADEMNGFVNASGMWPTDNETKLGGTGLQSDKIVGGMVTPDGLAVFTREALYLMLNTDGSNTLVDTQGCSSRRSLARIGDTIYGVNRNGVFATTGRSPLETISRRVDPLFQAEDPTLSTAAGCRSFRSYLLSYDRGAEHMMLDVLPETGSIMAHDYPAAAFVTGNLDNDEETFFLDATDQTKIRKAFDGGTFAGSSISCHYDTPFLDFGDDRVLKRLRRCRVVGRGDVYVTLRSDLGTADLDTERLAFPGIAGSLWDAASWDGATWGGYSLFEGFANTSARGRRIQIRLTEASTATYPMRTALGYDPPGSLGGAGVYLIEPQFTMSNRRR